MSLLNEALKKAQRQQHTEQQASARVIVQTSTGGAAPAVTRTGMSTRLFAVLIAGAVVLVSGSVLGTVLLLRNTTAPAGEKEAAAETAQVPEKIAAAPVVTPTPVLTAPPAPAPVTDVGSLAIHVPAATVAAPAPASPAAPEPVATTPAEPAPVATTPEAPATPTIRIASLDDDTAAARETAAYSVINALRISGIRGTGADCRVLIDGRVYRLNAVIDRTLGLRLTGVEADRILFTDSHGTVFTRML